jgi:hypothetical protein
VKRFVVGVLIGLAVGLPAGAGGWWVYSERPERNASAERQRAGEVASEWLQRRCPFCSVAGFDRTEDKGWRVTVRTEGGNRVCYRMEIDRFALNLDGVESVRQTACDNTGWTEYAPLAP